MTETVALTGTGSTPGAGYARGPLRDEIMASTSPAMLVQWYRDAVVTIEEIRASVEGYRMAGIAEADWLQRVGKKLGYLKHTARWCELRLLELGYTVPYLPSDPRTRQIRLLEDRVKLLAGALVAGGLEVPDRG